MRRERTSVKEGSLTIATSGPVDLCERKKKTQTFVDDPRSNHPDDFRCSPLRRCRKVGCRLEAWVKGTKLEVVCLQKVATGSTGAHIG